MFEPDGRNSIQYAGHTAMVAARWICMLLGLMCIIPVALYVYGRNTMNLQEASIFAVNTDHRSQEVTLDFNAPTLRMSDVEDYEQWSQHPAVTEDEVAAVAEEEELGSGPAAYTEDNPYTEEKALSDQKDYEARQLKIASAKKKKALDPSLSSLPFTATFGKLDNATLSSLPWTYRGIQINPTAWIHYNLPYDKGEVNDPNFEQASNAGLASYGTNGNVNLRETQQRVNSLYSPDNGWDPWFSQGLYKMAPTKLWDWHTGLQLIQAKASYNYAAYVAAARVTGSMRMLIASRAAGVSGLNSSPVPARVVIQLPKSARKTFVTAYCKAFAKKLPVVYIHVQQLDSESLMHFRQLKEFFGQADGGRWFSMAQCNMISEGPYIVSMSLSSSKYSAGELEYTSADFFYRSTPYINQDAEDAQDALTDMLSMSFWAPLLKAEGADQAVMNQAATILQMEKVCFNKDLQFAKMHGHEVFFDPGGF